MEPTVSDLLFEAPGFTQATGLMWESAEEFKALLVFAEHR
jgi:hypothetical protein